MNCDLFPQVESLVTKFRCRDPKTQSDIKDISSCSLRRLSPRFEDGREAEALQTVGIRRRVCSFNYDAYFGKLRRWSEFRRRDPKTQTNVEGLLSCSLRGSSPRFEDGREAEGLQTVVIRWRVHPFNCESYFGKLRRWSEFRRRDPKT